MAAPIIAEFREFFSRHVQVNSGSKPDKESGYPTKYFIGADEKYNRFLKGDYPSEGVFSKFLKSIGFKLNPEDTATEDIQGFGKACSDEDAEKRTDLFTDGFTRFVQPHQLTQVFADNTGSATVTVTPLNDTTPNSREYLAYKIRVDLIGTGFPTRLLYSDNVPANCGTVTGGGSKAFRSYKLLANTLTTNGDFLDIDCVYFNNVTFAGDLVLKNITNGQILSSFTISGGGFTPITYFRLKTRLIRVSASLVDCYRELITYRTINTTALTYTKLVEDIAFDCTINNDISMNIDTINALTTNDFVGKSMSIVLYKYTT